MTAEQAQIIIDNSQTIIVLIQDVLIGLGLLGGILITQTFWSFLKGANK